MNKSNGVHLSKSSQGRFRPVAFSGIDYPSTCQHGVVSDRRAVPWIAGKRWGGLLCAAYPLLAITPMLALHGLGYNADHSAIAQLGIDSALVGFKLLSLQFVLTARFTWIEFGLDVILRFHRVMALVAVILLCAHPVFLAGAEGWTLLIRLKMHWYLWAGRIALALLLAHVATALFRGAMRLPYEHWRGAHNLLAVTILALGFVHAIKTGDDLHGGLRFTVFALWPAIGLSALLYSRAIRPRLLARRAFRVHSVRQEATQVWTVTLDAPPGQPLRFLPGQFQFLRFIDSDLPAEEHPFTIASSPTVAERINVTIKSCGDFTDLIDRIRSGDRATVRGPFGRFSHDIYSNESHLVFVAGGVGITPLMSMLRAMRDRREARRVTLVYASRTLDDVLFTPELIAMESAGNPVLDVIYVLSDPPPWWTGEAGRVDVQRLAAWCGGLEGKSFYLCCPPSMNVALVRGLRRRGVSATRIHCDHFSL